MNRDLPHARTGADIERDLRRHPVSRAGHGDPAHAGGVFDGKNRSCAQGDR